MHADSVQTWNAYGLVYARLFNCAAASLPWRLLQTYLESCANIVQTARPTARSLAALRDVVRSRNPSKSTLAHDAVSTAVLHKHHLIIRVGAGLIQFVYRSHLRLATEATRNRNAFSPFFRASFSDDGLRIVCRLKQTCTPTGAARKGVMTVTDVMILNYAVGLDVARDVTQCNTQGVWPCKLPIDSLPLQILAISPDLMEALRKQPRRNFPWTVTCSQETHDKKPSIMKVKPKKIAHDHNKIEMS